MKTLISIIALFYLSRATLPDCTDCAYGSTGPCKAKSGACAVSYGDDQCYPGTYPCDGKLYSCISESCEESSSGTYSSLSACQSACSTPETKYTCNSGTCEQSSTGSYDSLSNCQSACSTPATKYACNSEICSESSTGSYDSLSDCQSACETNNISEMRYSCTSESCAEDQNGQYDTLSDCQVACDTQYILLNDSNWSKRDGQWSTSGPGPNYWDRGNTFLDDDGKLHMKITRRDDGKYNCAEYDYGKALGYGKYTFDIDFNPGDITSQDNNIVFGFFIYKDDTHELDIEFSKWGCELCANSDYVVQPGFADLWNSESHNSQTHWIDFTPEKITFSSHQTGNESSYYDWTYSNITHIPDPTDMIIIFNFWMFRGTGTVTEVEAVVSSLKFEPYVGNLLK